MKQLNDMVVQGVHGKTKGKGFELGLKAAVKIKVNRVVNCHH